MSRLEYLLAGALLRIARVFFSRLKVRRNRVVLATARVSTLDGNLLHIHRAMVERHPELDYVLLLEPYSYGLADKLAYYQFLNRTLEWDADFEAKIRALTPDQIAAALRRHLDMAKVIIVKAGDFTKTASATPRPAP